MNIEFHYTITHLIAARAGIRGDALRILAHASQLTDDNNTAYPIRRGRKVVYENRISQTMQPLKSHRALPNDSLRNTGHRGAIQRLIFATCSPPPTIPRFITGTRSV